MPANKILFPSSTHTWPWLCVRWCVCVRALCHCCTFSPPSAWTHPGLAPPRPRRVPCSRRLRPHVLVITSPCPPQPTPAPLTCTHTSPGKFKLSHMHSLYFLYWSKVRGRGMLCEPLAQRPCWLKKGKLVRVACKSWLWYAIIFLMFLQW